MLQPGVLRECETFDADRESLGHVYVGNFQNQAFWVLSAHTPEGKLVVCMVTSEGDGGALWGVSGWALRPGHSGD